MYRYLYSTKDIHGLLFNKNSKKLNLQNKSKTKLSKFNSTKQFNKKELSNFTFLSKPPIKNLDVGKSGLRLSNLKKMSLHLRSKFTTKLTFNNLFFETNFIHRLPWRSRKF